MLKRLYISNYALISEAEVTFPGNLSVITGETGAGKSIFLEALGLVLGKRADQSALADKLKKCVVEGEFDITGLELQDFFTEQGLEYQDQAILRRELGADGRSRSLINDSAVGLNILKQLGEKLVDVHSQHQTLLLNREDFQLSLVDAFAGTSAKFDEYKKSWNRLSNIAENLQTLKEQESKARKEYDYFEFLFKELEEANISEGELKKLEEEASSLENAENIKRALLQTSEALTGADAGVLVTLAHLKQTLAGLSRFGAAYSEIAERFNSTCIELKELAREIETSGTKIHFDHDRLEQINNSVDLLNRLLRKHDAPDESALLKTKKEIEEKLHHFNSLESAIANIEKEKKDAQLYCNALAEEISASRQKALSGIEKRIKSLLVQLGMESVSFQIKTSKKESLGPRGLDDLNFLFSANKGGVPAELQKVASGGELSRLMLALKSTLAEKKKLPCIVFDEIDTGVSGAVADKMGSILFQMGINMQVIAITHLPQVASKGEHHLFIYKEEAKGKTRSYIKELDEKARVTEIAKMLSRGNPTETAINNARELLSL